MNPDNLNPEETNTEIPKVKKNPFAEEFKQSFKTDEHKKEELPKDTRVSGVPRKVYIEDAEKLRLLQYKNLDNVIKVYDILDDLLSKMDNQKTIEKLEKKFEKTTIEVEKHPDVKSIRVTPDFINFANKFTTVDRGNRFHGNKKLDFKKVFKVILDEYLSKYTTL